MLGTLLLAIGMGLLTWSICRTGSLSHPGAWAAMAFAMVIISQMSPS